MDTKLYARSPQLCGRAQQVAQSIFSDRLARSDPSEEEDPFQVLQHNYRRIDRAFPVSTEAQQIRNSRPNGLAKQGAEAAFQRETR